MPSRITAGQDQHALAQRFNKVRQLGCDSAARKGSVLPSQIQSASDHPQQGLGMSQSRSPGNTFSYLTAVRGAAIMSATVSRHRW